MYKRLTFIPPAPDAPLSERVEFRTHQFILQYAGKDWLDPLREFKILKNLVDLRLDSLREQVIFNRPLGNQKMINQVITTHCRVMATRLKDWNYFKFQIFNALEPHPQADDLKKMIEEYFPCAYAKNYIFTITALASFDKNSPDMTEQLVDIYNSDAKLEKMSEKFAQCQILLENWRIANKDNKELIAVVNNHMEFLEKELNIKPLAQVRCEL